MKGPRDIAISNDEKVPAHVLAFFRQTSSTYPPRCTPHHRARPDPDPTSDLPTCYLLLPPVYHPPPRRPPSPPLRSGPHLSRLPPATDFSKCRRLTTQRLSPHHVHSKVTRNTFSLKPDCATKREGVENWGRTAQAVEARRGQVSASRSRWYLDSWSTLAFTRRRGSPLFCPSSSCPSCSSTLSGDYMKGTELRY